MNSLTSLPIYSHGPLGDRPGEKFVYLRDLYTLLMQMELGVRDNPKLDQTTAIAYKVLRETLEGEIK